MTPVAAAHAIPARFDTVFQHEYPVDHPELRRLYENAKRDQWNVSKDIDWTAPVDLERGVLADPERRIAANRQPARCCDRGCTEPGQSIMVEMPRSRT